MSNMYYEQLLYSGQKYLNHNRALPENSGILLKSVSVMS